MRSSGRTRPRRARAGPALRLWGLAVAGGLAFALVVALLDANTGLWAWWRIETDLDASRATNAGLAARNHELREEVRALEQDPFALERAIREDLDLVRPGEWLVRFRVPPGPHANPRFP